MYDVLNNESIAAMINKVAEDLGGIYGLVNHCPGPKAGTFEALTEADWADGYQKCLYSYTTASWLSYPKSTCSHLINGVILLPRYPFCLNRCAVGPSNPAQSSPARSASTFRFISCR